MANEWSVPNPGSFVTKTVGNSRSSEIEVESSMIEVVEDGTTQVRTRIRLPRKKATVSHSSSSGCCCNRLCRIMTPAGRHRKACEAVVLILAIIVCLVIGSAPTVLYFTLAVSMSCTLLKSNHISVSIQIRYPMQESVHVFSHINHAGIGRFIKRESQKWPLCSMSHVEPVCVQGFRP